MDAMTKHDLRVRLRSQFKGAEERSMQSRLLCQHVLNSPLYTDARVIGGYMHMQHEADITPVLQHALQNGKSLALPRCGRSPQMTFHHVRSLDDLVTGAYGLLEPLADAPVVQPDEMHLLLVPLEGIDQQGYRLGKGGGYYDHLLADAHVKSMGCALRWQWMEKVLHDPWDQRLYACADPDGIRMF